MVTHSTLKTLNNFYASSRWMKLRAALIAERGPRCQQCGKVESNPAKLTGHHTIELTPENVMDASVSLNPKHVKIVCFDCHQKTHQRFGHENTGRRVCIVYGPPCSGKSTYVREHARRGDIVVDTDRLFAAISMQPEYDKPDNLLANVFGIHDLLIDNIKTRYGKWHSAWVVGGYADKRKREKMADELGAELVFCDASKEECFARLARDEGRRMRQEEWKVYIEEWYEEYRA